MEALYLTRPTNFHESLLIVDESKLQATMAGINLKPLGSAWTRPQFHFEAVKKESARHPSICTVYYSGVIAIRHDLRDALFPRTAGIEFLPIDVGGEEWLMVNCLNEVKVFDEAASTVMRDEGVGGQIFMVTKLVVNDSAASGFDIFTLAGSNHADLFVRPAFKERVERLGLEGIDFHPIGSVAS